MGSFKEKKQKKLLQVDKKYLLPLNSYNSTHDPANRIIFFQQYV